MATQIVRDSMIDIHFPKAGMDLSIAFAKQPAKQLLSGEYARTTPIAANVRGFESTTFRDRGGSRDGLKRFWPNQVSGEVFITQELALMSQTSNSGRLVFVVAVSQGRVFTAGPGDTVWVEPSYAGPNPPLRTSGLVRSAPNNQKLWFADGKNWAYYDSSANTVFPWVASAGTLPVDADGNTPRLIVTWRGRTVLSGLIKDPQNWFMSKIGDPTNFDYSPESPSPSDAVAGNNAPLGTIGDVITTMIPYTDDVLVFGGNNTIWMMRGDPADGGRVDLISDIIGMAFGIPWCKDPYGSIYFVSNRMGIYTLVPGNTPVRISQPIEQLIQTVDTGANSIRCVWDDRFQGMHVFITPIAAPMPALHFFYEQRSGAWFMDQFANVNHNPLCCCLLDGNTVGDRVPIIGSWDGYVRSITAEALDDDGTEIFSEVIIGPLVSSNLDEIMLYSMQAVLGEGSADVKYEILIAETAEAALQSEPVETGTWTAGRNYTDNLRLAGFAIYVRLSSQGRWSMESIRARVGPLGKIRQRGK